MTELEGQTGKYLAWVQGLRSEHSDREPNIFLSGPPTQSISILSYDHSLLKILKILFEPKKDMVTEDQTAARVENICHLFLRIKKETHTSSKNTTHVLIFVQFMLKSQQKVDIKLSKICQNHQKLSEWQKVASCFTEIVYKSSSEDSRKCWRRFKLFVDLLDSLKQGTTSNWLLRTQMLAPADSAWVCWLCWLICWCSGPKLHG